MARAIYFPVKICLIVILVLGLVSAVSLLVPEIGKTHSNVQFVIVSVISILVLIIGLVGSYQDNRQYLLIYAIVIIFVIVLEVIRVQTFHIVGNAIVNLISIFLALWQAEMIRTG